MNERMNELFKKKVILSGCGFTFKQQYIKIIIWKCAQQSNNNIIFFKRLLLCVQILHVTGAKWVAALIATNLEYVLLIILILYSIVINVPDRLKHCIRSKWIIINP